VSAPSSEPLQSGLGGLDALTGGGLPHDSSSLIIGPAGIGKSTISTLYAMAAAARGENSSILLFDESVETHLTRSTGLGLDVAAARDQGRVRLTHLDPAELSVGQIADLVMRQVEEENVKVVVIDTLNGYLQSAMRSRLSFYTFGTHLLSKSAQSRDATDPDQHGILGPRWRRRSISASFRQCVFVTLFRGAGRDPQSLVHRQKAQREP